MIPDAIAYAKWCHACQIYGDVIHQHQDIFAYEFFMAIWDVRNGRGRSYQPALIKGYQFILVITDYFSKWAEVVPLKEVKTSDVIKFIKHHVIYRFGVPRWIVHDNGAQFVSQVFQSSAKNSESKVCLQWHNSLPLTAL